MAHFGAKMVKNDRSKPVQAHFGHFDWPKSGLCEPDLGAGIHGLTHEREWKTDQNRLCCDREISSNQNFWFLQSHWDFSLPKLSPPSGSKASNPKKSSFLPTTGDPAPSGLAVPYYILTPKTSWKSAILALFQLAPSRDIFAILVRSNLHLLALHVNIAQVVFIQLFVVDFWRLF